MYKIVTSERQNKGTTAAKHMYVQRKGSSRTKNAKLKSVVAATWGQTTAKKQMKKAN